MGDVVTLHPGGASNSRPRLKSETADAGLDTVRLRFRATPEQTWRFFDRTNHEGWVAAPRDEYRKTRDGVTVGVYPDGLTYVEGRVASLLGTPDVHDLAPADALPLAESVWRDTLALDRGTVCEVGRADVTAELRFPDPRDGHDLLAALRSVDHPWLKVGTEGFKRGEVETVYGRYARGRSVQLRVYDKGLESGDAPAGTRIRFERQRRFRKDRARTTAEFAATPLADWFVGRELRSLVEREREDVVVCNEVGALRELRALAGSGDLGWQACERLIGYVWLRGHGQSRATRYRREAELSALGIKLDRSLHESIRVPVGAYVRQLVGALAA